MSVRRPRLLPPLRGPFRSDRHRSRARPAPRNGSDLPDTRMRGGPCGPPGAAHNRPSRSPTARCCAPWGDDEGHRCTWTSSARSGTRRRWCWCRTRPPWRRSRRGGGARSSSSIPRPRRSASLTGTTGDRGGRAAVACGRSGARARLPRDSERVKQGARVEALRLPVADAWLPARYTASPTPFLEGDALTGPGSRASHRAPAEPGLGPCGLRSLSRAPRRPRTGSRAAGLRD